MKHKLIGIMLAALIAGRSLLLADFSYSSFVNSSELTLNGASAVVDGVLRLTPAQVSQSGSAFTTNLVGLSNLKSFSTYFQFRISGSGGAGDVDGPGADGLCFVVQTQANNVGGAGGGMGYAGVAPSIAVEFDTYYNSGVESDPNGNHVGINLNGDLHSVATASEPTRFNNGSTWNVWIDYDGAAQVLEVRWSQSGSRPSVAGLSYSADLASIISQPNAFIGFSAATGDGFGSHEITRWEFKGTYNPLPDAPLPALAINQAIALKFQSTVGETYVIEQSSDLVNWTSSVSGIEGNGTIMSYYFDLTTPKVFYRLKRQ